MRIKYTIFILCLIILNSNVEARTNPLLRLKIFSTTNYYNSDETVIYFDTNASEDFDVKYDAYKLMNTAPELPNLYTILNSVKYSINCLPDINSNLTIPVAIKTLEDGNYTLQVLQNINFPSPMKIYLLDTETGLNYCLNNNPEISLNLKANDSDSRFVLKFFHLPKLFRTSNIYSSGYKSTLKYESVNCISISNNDRNFRLIQEHNGVSYSSSQIGDIYIYNFNSQLINSLKSTSTGKIQLQKGNYILVHKTNNHSNSYKVIIN